MKKKSKVRMPAKGHDIPKKEEGGPISSELDKAKLWKKPPTQIDKQIGKGDSVEG